MAGGGSEQGQALQATVWRTRIEDLLEGLDDDAEREQAATELRALLEYTAAAGGGSRPEPAAWPPGGTSA